MGDDVLNRAVAHYKALVGQPKEIHAPEWAEEGEDDFVIYTTPLTLHERMKVEKLAGDNSAEMACLIVILKAKKANGDLVFTMAHKPKMMKFVDSGVVGRIAREMMGDDDDILLLEDVEGN